MNLGYKNRNVVRVRAIRCKGDVKQKIVTIPKDLEIEVGDLVEVTKKETI
jgi:hypothetical protein